MTALRAVTVWTAAWALIATLVTMVGAMKWGSDPVGPTAEVFLLTTLIIQPGLCGLLWGLTWVWDWVRGR